jgi:N-acetylmuramoyl-L-alanine amidase
LLDARRSGLAAQLAFRVMSAGESSPVASNATAEGQARNRRVEVLFGRGRAEPAVVQAFPVDAPDELFLENVARAAPEQVVVPLGSAGRIIQGTGPQPVGVPGFTWITTDSAVARVSPLTDSQAHPNRVTVLGLRPGTTTLRMHYRSQRRASTFDLPIVVTGIDIRLRDPDETVRARATELVRPVPSVPNGIAQRVVEVRLEPSAFWAGKALQWAFTPEVAIRGALPAGRAILEAAGSSPFDSGTRRSTLDAQGTAAVRVLLPALAFNRGQLTVVSTDEPRIRAAVNLEVPGVVVIDPGHGGSRTVGDSSPNNATGVVSHSLEKNLTLDMGRSVRNALLQDLRLLLVVLTRDCDVNMGIVERAVLAACHGADVFLSIHFNGGPATRRGTSVFVRANANGNVNRTEDAALAQRVLDAIVAAIPNGRSNGVLDDTVSQHGRLGVLNDASLGNTQAHHPIRACLAEVEFLTNANADREFNVAPDHVALRQGVAQAIARAIVTDLAAQP